MAHFRVVLLAFFGLCLGQCDRLQAQAPPGVSGFTTLPQPPSPTVKGMSFTISGGSMTMVASNGLALTVLTTRLEVFDPAGALVAADNQATAQLLPGWNVSHRVTRLVVPNVTGTWTARVRVPCFVNGVFTTLGTSEKTFQVIDMPQMP